MDDVTFILTLGALIISAPLLVDLVREGVRMFDNDD